MGWFQNIGGPRDFQLGPTQNIFDAGLGDKSDAEILRDNYGAANPDWLNSYNSNTTIHVELRFVDSGDAVAIKQNNISGTWTDQQSTFGVRGLPGSGTDFSAISENHVPAIGPGPDKIPFDSGLTVDPQGNLITPRSIQAGPGSLKVGPTFTLSNGVEAVALTLGDGTKALGLNLEYGEGGSTHPFIYELSAQETLNINRTQDQTLADPFELAYTTAGDNLTVDFDVVPSETGELRVQFFQGGDDTGELVFDEIKEIEASQVGTVVRFEVGNPYLFGVGTPLFVRFSGVQLKGGVAGPDDLLNGQTTIYFRSYVNGYVKKNLAMEEDFTPAFIGAERSRGYIQLDRQNSGSVSIPVADYDRVYRNLGEGATSGSVSINLIESAWVDCHPDVQNVSRIYLPSNGNLDSDESFVIDFTRVAVDKQFDIEIPNTVFRDGSTSIDIRAGHMLKGWAHIDNAAAPQGPENPVRVYFAQLGTEGNPSITQSNADETNAGDPSFIQNFQKYRDLLSSERTFGSDRDGVWSDVASVAVGDLIQVGLPLATEGGLLHWGGSQLIPPQGFATSDGSTGDDVSYSRSGITTVTLEAGETKSGPVLVYHDAGVDKYLTAPRPDKPSAFVIGHVLNATLPGQQVSLYYDFGQSLMAAAYLDSPLPDGLNTIYVNLEVPSGGDGNRAFPFSTVADALTQASTIPSGQHKQIIALGVENVGSLTNTSLSGNVGNLIFNAPECTLTGVTLADHATTVLARVVDGDVQLADQCSLQTHNIVSPLSASITFTAEVHSNTLIKSRRIESTVDINFSSASSGSRIIVQVDHYEGDISASLQTVPVGVEVSGWIGDYKLPLNTPSFSNFEGLPSEFQVIDSLERSFSVIYDIQFVDHVNAASVVARRGAVTEQLTSNLNFNQNGRNTGTIQFTATDLTNLKAGTGNITISALLSTGSISHGEVHLATIAEDGGIIDEVPASQTRNYVKQPTGGSFQIQELEGALLLCNTSAAIDIEDAGYGLVFEAYTLGSGVAFSGINGATVSGQVNPSANKLLRVIRTSTNNYQVIEVG